MYPHEYEYILFIFELYNLEKFKNIYNDDY